MDSSDFSVGEIPLAEEAKENYPPVKHFAAASETLDIQGVHSMEEVADPSEDMFGPTLEEQEADEREGYQCSGSSETDDLNITPALAEFAPADLSLQPEEIQQRLSVHSVCSGSNILHDSTSPLTAVRKKTPVDKSHAPGMPHSNPEPEKELNRSDSGAAEIRDDAKSVSSTTFKKVLRRQGLLHQEKTQSALRSEDAETLSNENKTSELSITQVPESADTVPAKEESESPARSLNLRRGKKPRKITEKSLECPNLKSLISSSFNTEDKHMNVSSPNIASQSLSRSSSVSGTQSQSLLHSMPAKHKHDSALNKKEKSVKAHNDSETAGCRQLTGENHNVEGEISTTKLKTCKTRKCNEEFMLCLSSEVVVSLQEIETSDGKQRAIEILCEKQCTTTIVPASTEETLVETLEPESLSLSGEYQVAGGFIREEEDNAVQSADACVENQSKVLVVDTQYPNAKEKDLSSSDQVVADSLQNDTSDTSQDDRSKCVKEMTAKVAETSGIIENGKIINSAEEMASSELFVAESQKTGMSQERPGQRTESADADVNRQHDFCSLVHTVTSTAKSTGGCKNEGVKKPDVHASPSLSGKSRKRKSEEQCVDDTCQVQKSPRLVTPKTTQLDETQSSSVSVKMVCSAPPPATSVVLDSDDDDGVLIVRRTKRKCFSLDGSPLRSRTPAKRLRPRPRKTDFGVNVNEGDTEEFKDPGTSIDWDGLKEDGVIDQSGSVGPPEVENEDLKDDSHTKVASQRDSVQQELAHQSGQTVYIYKDTTADQDTTNRDKDVEETPARRGKKTKRGLASAMLRDILLPFNTDFVVQQNSVLPTSSQTHLNDAVIDVDAACIDSAHRKRDCDSMSPTNASEVNVSSAMDNATATKTVNHECLILNQLHTPGSASSAAPVTPRSQNKQLLTSPVKSLEITHASLRSETEDATLPPADFDLHFDDSDKEDDKMESIHDEDEEDKMESMHNEEDENVDCGKIDEDGSAKMIHRDDTHRETEKISSLMHAATGTVLSTRGSAHEGFNKDREGSLQMETETGDDVLVISDDVVRGKKEGASRGTAVGDTDVSVVEEIGDNSNDDEKGMVKKRTKAKRPVIDSDTESTRNSGDESEASFQLNFTSSSAMSSQSENISTQQRTTMEAELVRLRAEIAEMESKLHQRSSKSDSGGDSCDTERKSASNHRASKKKCNADNGDDEHFQPSSPVSSKANESHRSSKKKGDAADNKRQNQKLVRDDFDDDDSDETTSKQAAAGDDSFRPLRHVDNAIDGNDNFDEDDDRPCYEHRDNNNDGTDTKHISDDEDQILVPSLTADSDSPPVVRKKSRRLFVRSDSESEVEGGQADKVEAAEVLDGDEDDICVCIPARQVSCHSSPICMPTNEKNGGTVSDDDSDDLFLSPLSPTPPPAPKHTLTGRTSGIDPLFPFDLDAIVVGPGSPVVKVRKSLDFEVKGTKNAEKNDVNITVSSKNSDVSCTSTSKSNKDVLTSKTSHSHSQLHKYDDLRDSQDSSSPSASHVRNIPESQFSDDSDKAPRSSRRKKEQPKLTRKSRTQESGTSGSMCVIDSSGSPAHSPGKSLCKTKEQEAVSQNHSPATSRRVTKEKKVDIRNENGEDEEIPRWKRKKMGFITSGLDQEKSMQLRQLAEANECKVYSKFNDHVTHVIIRTRPGSRVCERTLKYFQGVAGRCWLLSFDWVVDSLETGRALPEARYEVKGDTVKGDNHKGPKVARLASDPLLAGFAFACVGVSPDMSKKEVTQLLTMSGAEVVEDPWDLNGHTAKCKLVIRCVDSDNQPPTPAEIELFNGQYKHFELVTVAREWILDSICTYTLQPLADYIFNTNKDLRLPL